MGAMGPEAAMVSYKMSAMSGLRAYATLEQVDEFSLYAGLARETARRNEELGAWAPRPVGVIQRLVALLRRERARGSPRAPKSAVGGAVVSMARASGRAQTAGSISSLPVARPERPSLTPGVRAEERPLAFLPATYGKVDG